MPLAALQQGGIRPIHPAQQQQWNRHKSISEANLLAMEYNRVYHPGTPQHLHSDPRRASVAEFGHHHMPHHDVVDHR